MKVDKVLYVSDSNLNYLSFWPSVSRFTKKHLGIDCKLFFIGEPDEQTKKFLVGDVQVVRPIPDVPIIIQALWAKFWFTQTEPDTNWLIGDIDMYIFDKTKMLASLDQIPEDGYGHVHMGIHDGKPYFPGYHHAASGRKFKEYLELTDDFESECRFIQTSKKYGIFGKTCPPRIKDKKDYEYICCEEQLTTERLSKRFSELTIIYPENHIRFETPWAYHGENTPVDYDMVRQFKNRPKEEWSDFHCPRPYTQWSNQIEEILSSWVPTA